MTKLTSFFAATIIAGVMVTTGAAATAASASGVNWAPCETDAECGILKVPVDWSKPRAATIDVAVARHAAEDPARRIGTLFFNPGGPGDGETFYVRYAATFFPAELRQRFDIVALDPRGFGENEPIRCSVPALTPDWTLFPRTQGQFDNLVRHNTELARSCLRDSGERFLHSDTRTVARDHEALRRALGESRVSWLGVSYGTSLAAAYADLFPGRTRAMVLDAALDHNLPEVYQVATEAATVEDSFNRFVAWCATSPTCAVRGLDVAAEFDRLVARADEHPIPVEGAMRPVTGEDIRMGTKGAIRFKSPTVFGDRFTWALFSQQLKAALAGDASAFALPPEDVPQNSTFGVLANACMDYVPQVRTWAEMQQRLTLGEQVAPHLKGASETWAALQCIGFPFRPTNPPHEVHITGVQTLMVHSAHDPSDNYIWTHGLATQIEGSKLLTRTGDGHTSWWSSPRTRAAITAHLINPAATPANALIDE